MVETSFESSDLSSERTSVMARTAAVLIASQHRIKTKPIERLAFLCTTVPNLALPFTIAYGTPIFRHSAGRKITNSIGSTSLGISTNAAFLFSIKPTTWFSPYFTAYGFLLTSSFFFPSLTAVASLSKRSFFSALVSGRYLLRSLKAWAAVLRSRWLVNWAMAGGTLRRRLRIFFWRSGLVN